MKHIAPDFHSLHLQPYRKRPVVIYAMEMHEAFEVETIEGVMTGKPGDYLIQGVKGEFYPCDREIFEATYDGVKAGGD